MRRLLPLLLAAVLSGCSVTIPGSQAPTPTPEISTPVPATLTPALDSTLRVEAGGFEVRPPLDWITQVVSSTATIAPSEAALDRASPGPELVLTIDATPLEALAAQFGAGATRDPQGFFAVSSEAARSAGYTIGATEAITIDGRTGLAAHLSAPGGVGRLAVILAEDTAVRVLGQSAPEAWEDQARYYYAMLDSLRFFGLPEPTPLPTDSAEQPLVVDDGPEGFVLRLGGSAGPPDGRFISARGLAAAPDGTLYLAESRRGVWVFAPDGELIGTFGADQLLDAYDVARAPGGELYVADFGRNAIARFQADGTFMSRWGSAGDGEGQFGLASPQRISVGPDGSVYALDSRPGRESGRVVSSILRFSVDGRPLGRIELPADLSPADLTVAQDGVIYLAEGFGGVVKLRADGTELARFGNPADPQSLAAAAIDLDRQGNIYLATYSSGIVRMAPSGLIVARGGGVAAAGSTPAPGEFSLPNGIAAAPGGVVWVSDNSGEYSAVTAVRLRIDQAALATAQAQVTAVPEATAIPTPNPETLVRQWANEATASSFYAPDYDPAGATGPPDVPACQDSPDAWAAADPNGLETLELRFRSPIFAVGVVVHQSYNPGFISKVELIDERGEVKTVYTAIPAPASTCPATLEINFEQTLTRIVAVRLTVDQRPGANWNEIDAVELIGVP